jgi:hypothetical protein
MILIISLSFFSICYLLYRKLWKKKSQSLKLFDDKNEVIRFPIHNKNLIEIRNKIVKEKIEKQTKNEITFLDDDYMDLINKKFESEKKKNKEIKEFHQYNQNDLNVRFLSQSLEQESNNLKNRFHVNRFDEFESK